MFDQYYDIVAYYFSYAFDVCLVVGFIYNLVFLTRLTLKDQKELESRRAADAVQ